MSTDFRMLPIRVLHVHSGNLYGGIETCLVTLARCKQLCAEMQPEFALCFEGRLSEELREYGATVQTLGEVRARYPWTVSRARKALQHLLEQRRYDVVVCHSPWSQGIFGSLIRRSATANVLVLHGRASGRHWLDRWAKRARPDYAICNSRYTQESLANLYPELHGQPVYYPVTPRDQFSPAERSAVRLELQTPQESAVIIQVSRMEAWKGHFQHLEALGELRTIPAWVAWIVGGAQRPQERKYLDLLKGKARQLQIMDRIRFVGQRNDVMRLLAAADIFCQPNLEGEPFGISFVEALYAGLPVVTTNMGGAREIIDESCGVLVPPGDSHALCDALGRLIDSPTLRSALGDAARGRALEISDPRTQMPKLYQILRHVVTDFADTATTEPLATESNLAQ